MSERYVIKLSVCDRTGTDAWHMATNSDEFPVFSERLIDEMKAGVAFLGPSAMDQAVTVVKKREFRRELLMEAAKKLAGRLADYIEDSEGWHGEKRREIIKQNRR